MRGKFFSRSQPGFILSSVVASKTEDKTTSRNRENRRNVLFLTKLYNSLS